MLTDEQAEKNIIANLRRLRGERTYAEIARACGTYPINISRIERGLHFPQPGLLARIAEALGVSVDTLLRDPPEPRRKKSS